MGLSGSEPQSFVQVWNPVATTRITEFGTQQRISQDRSQSSRLDFSPVVRALFVPRKEVLADLGDNREVWIDHVRNVIFHRVPK